MLIVFIVFFGGKITLKLNIHQSGKWMISGLKIKIIQKYEILKTEYIN